MNLAKVFQQARYLLEERVEQVDRFRPAVYGVLFNANMEVLLCLNKHRSNFWNFPGGGIEPGESPMDALIREFREEVGLEVQPVMLIWATKGRHHNWFRPGQQLLGTYYIVDAVGGQVHTAGNGEDVNGCQWFPVQALPTESMSPFDRELADVLKQLFIE